MSQSSNIRIAVVFPSRGLAFSQTADELLQNLQGFDYEIFFSHGESIPMCFEKPLQWALNSLQRFSHVWIVEDDMVLPEETLAAMLLMDAPVVTCDYPVSKEGQGAVFTTKEGKVLFSGTGCLLVKKEVFDKLEQPWFRSDIHWGAVNYGDFIRFTANKVTNPEVGGYGLHDVNFGMKLWQVDIPISVAGNIGQRKLIALGKPGTNEGAHQIETWTKIKPNLMFKRLKSTKALPTGILIPVQTVDGEMMVHPDKAKRLIKAGVAARIKRQSVSVDYNEIEI